jgi:hypothetical protein
MPDRSVTTIPPPDSLWLRLPGARRLLVEEYRIEQDIERARSERAVEPDMDWVHTDPAGHVHRFVTPEDEGVATPADWLPTLVKEHRHVDCDGSCFEITHGDYDGYDEPVWFCRECGAEIEPGVKPDLYVRDVGLPVKETVTWTIVVKSQDALPETIEGDLAVVIERSEDGTRVVREDVIPLPTPLYCGEQQIERSGSGTQFSTTYTGTEYRTPKRRPQRL